MESSNLSPRCLVRGSINIDEFFHVKDIVRPGETISSNNLSKRAGGKGANQAVAVVKAFGGNVSLVGAVGSDGEWVRKLLLEYGVEVGGVQVVEGSTGRAIIQLTETGENSIILYKGANYTYLPSSPSTSLDPFTHVLLQNEIPFESTLAYLSLAKEGKRRITTVYNPSPMPSPAQISEEFKWEHVDWLLVNEGEAQQLLDAFPSEVGLNSDPQTSEKIPSTVQGSYGLLNHLASQKSFVKTNIVCTLGPSGVLASFYTESSAVEIIYEPGIRIPTSEVRDTTGAGDCWTGFFAAGLMQWYSSNIHQTNKKQLGKLLKRCNQAAAQCVQKNGAMESIPMASEVKVEDILDASLE